MPKVELPGGRSAVIGLRMAEFREMWSTGAVRKLQGLNEEGGDLSESYPLLAIVVKSWDVTDMDGQPLLPGVAASYDELEPGTFMRLLGAVARYIGGEESKKLSKEAYLSIKGGTPPPMELLRAQVCERMGWTFAEYDAVDLTDMLGLLQVWDGVARAREKRT